MKADESVVGVEMPSNSCMVRHSLMEMSNQQASDGRQPASIKIISANISNYPLKQIDPSR